MAEPVGMASGILALAVFAFKSCHKLQKTIQEFKSLPRQVRELLTELSALTLVLRTLSETGDFRLDVDLTALLLTLEQCRQACDEVEAELSTYTRSCRDRTSFRDWLKLKCSGGDGIEGFRQQLIGYKSTISVALDFANLRTSAASAEAIQACRDSIATTTVDLETHLQDILQKLESLARQTAAGPDSDASKRRHMEGEKISTEKALLFCRQLSEQIDKVHADFLNDNNSFLPNSLDPGSVSGMLFGEGVEACKSHMRFTLRQLEERLNRITENRDAGSTPVDNQALVDRLQAEARTTRGCLDFLSNINAQISEIENHAEGDDSVQFMVSTDGKPLKGINKAKGQRLKQAGGHFGEISLQQVSQDFKAIALHQSGSVEQDSKSPTLVPSDRGDVVPESFNRHGRGFKLTASSAPTGSTSH